MSDDGTTLQRHIEKLVAKYGSLRFVSEAVKLDHAYLHRLRNGEKDNPSAAALKRLGLRRRTSYVVERMP